jgi:hypothetical protein
MGNIYDDFLDALEESEFEETPVDLDVFIYDKQYLGLPPLSEEQFNLVQAMTQIYKLETLISLYGEQKGTRRFKQTIFEVIAQLGKGSGKDYCSTIAVARVVYLLLCLKDPAVYYGKSEGDTIDIINIAVNAQQANNVFFAGLRTRIEKCPWFEGKYYIKAGAIEFDKNITCYSGHSERESWEGYNVFMVILDEISGFAMESTSGNVQAKTAGEIYKMYNGSVVSRFPKFGKVVLLSFPRYVDDFIQKKYKDAIQEVHTEIRTHTFKIDPELPDGTEGNEFKIEYEHDTVISYKKPRTYAVKRATWEVNPTWSLDDAMGAFMDDIVDSLSRFACMPPFAVDAYFKDKEKVEAAFSLPEKAFTDTWAFRENFVPDAGKEYFVHVDLAYKHDHCAVALAHVDSWRQIKIADNYSEPAPFVIVDAIRYWTPTADRNVDFDDVRNYIVALRQRGFKIKLVTFDRWQSIDTMNYLQKIGMETDRLSVSKTHYDDWALLIQEQRIKGPYIPLLVEEMLQLKIIKGNKVDHPRKGSKDLCDATAGAVYNAIVHTPREQNAVIDVHYLEPGMHRRMNPQDLEKKFEGTGVIVVPQKSANPPPEDISNFLERLRIIGD